MTSDTWHMLNGSYGTMCQMENKSNKSLSGAMWDMCHNLRRWKSKELDKRIRGNPREPMER